MTRKLLVPILLVALAALTSCARGPAGCCDADPAQDAPPPAPAAVAAEHPAMEAHEMLVACADCHREATPELTAQWFDSTHGLGGVKCYQCHGTFEDMERVPDLARCEPCHADKLENHGAERACWSCHPAHNFTGHR